MKSVSSGNATTRLHLARSIPQSPGNRADGQSNHRPPYTRSPRQRCMCDLADWLRNSQTALHLLELLCRARQKSRFGYRGPLDVGSSVIHSRHCCPVHRPQWCLLRKFSNSWDLAACNRRQGRVHLAEIPSLDTVSAQAMQSYASLDNVLFIGAYMFLNDLLKNSLIGGWNGGYQAHVRLLEMVVNG